MNYETLTYIGRAFEVPVLIAVFALIFIGGHQIIKNNLGK